MPALRSDAISAAPYAKKETFRNQWIFAGGVCFSVARHPGAVDDVDGIDAAD